MNYKETLDFLFSSLPMYHRVGQSAYKANLNNTIAFDKYLRHPHHKFKSIHIAGTNGKGSVAHMLAAVLQLSGYKTGLYTSPHIIDFRERIKINGKMISKSYVTDFISDNLNFIKELQPSFFEMCVALAFKYFADKKVDVAIIETGMGGRLDSTNIIHPLVSVITNIGFDHTQFLGNRIPEIAVEKAGIIKKQVPVVIGEWQKETEMIYSEVSKRNESVLMYASKIYHAKYSWIDPDRKQTMNIYHGDELAYKNLTLDLLGQYQRKNVPTVLQTLDVLRSLGYSITRQAIFDALSQVKTLTGLMGRWDVKGYDPLIIYDTGHNAPGIHEVISQIRQTHHKKLFMVMGLSDDKKLDSIFPLLPSKAQYFFTRADVPRALDPSILNKYAEKYKLNGKIYSSVREALKTAKSLAKKEDLIFVGGSTFIVAEALSTDV